METGVTDRDIPIDIDMASDFGLDKEELKAANVPLKFHTTILAGTRNEIAATLPAKYSQEQYMKVANQLSTYRRTQDQIKARATEGEEGRKVKREAIAVGWNKAKLNAETPSSQLLA